MLSREGVQRLLTAVGYYKGRIDGDWGLQTIEAAEAIVNNRKSELTENPALWNSDRLIIAAAQLVLKHAGYSPGVIDGYWGHNTDNAFDEWVSVASTGGLPVINRTPVPDPVPTKVKPYFPSQAGCRAFYGAPGLPGSTAEKAMAAKLVSIKLPFPFRIDWNVNQHVSSMRLHNKCAESAEAAYQKIFTRYGREKMVTLGLDRFAGSYMPRYMRGSTKTFSMHAYGCAIDTYAGPNGLNVHKPAALFSKPEYDDWFDIWAEFGWTSLGRVIDRDYMHVQAAHL